MANESGDEGSLLTTEPGDATDKVTETAPGTKDADPAKDAAAEKAAAAQLTKDIEALALKLPEGFDPKDATLADFKKMSAQSGLKTEAAQGLFDFHLKNLRAQVESAGKAQEQKWIDEHSATRKGWVEAAKSDKEIGGTKFAESLKAGHAVLTRFASDLPELKELLNRTGVGDHPAVVKLFARIGAQLKEDTVAKPNGGGTPAKSKGADWALLYPNSPELHA